VQFRKGKNMIGEFQLIVGDFNSGKIILEKGYKNVLVVGEELIEDLGDVEVRLLITEDMDEALCEMLLQIFTEEIEDLGFVAWFPLNNNQGCISRDNLGLDNDSTRDFCRNLIKSYGLKALSRKGFNNTELEAA
jgi:hypothetical protein